MIPVIPTHTYTEPSTPVCRILPGEEGVDAILAFLYIIHENSSK